MCRWVSGKIGNRYWQVKIYVEPGYEVMNIKVGDVAEDEGYIYFLLLWVDGWGLLTRETRRRKLSITKPMSPCPISSGHSRSPFPVSPEPSVRISGAASRHATHHATRIPFAISLPLCQTLSFPSSSDPPKGSRQVALRVDHLKPISFACTSLPYFHEPRRIENTELERAPYARQNLLMPPAIKDGCLSPRALG
jgi:hypothetical protein